MQSDPLNLQNFVTFVSGLQFSYDLNQSNDGIQYCQFFLGFIAGLNFNQKQKNNCIEKAKQFLKQLSFDMQLKTQELQIILEKYINGYRNIDKEISDDLMKFSSYLKVTKDQQFNHFVQIDQIDTVQSNQIAHKNSYLQNEKQREQQNKKLDKKEDQNQTFSQNSQEQDSNQSFFQKIKNKQTKLINFLMEKFYIEQKKKSTIIKKQNKKNLQTQQCKICLENLNEDEYFILNCQHIFHKNCLQDYVTHKNQLSITCPECRQDILIQDLQQFCNQQLFEKLEEATFQIFILQNTQIFQCPTRDCHGLYEIGGVNQLCIFCQKTFCTKCKRLQHEGICGEATFIKLAKKLKYCQCKKCLSWVEKISGCEHIKCKCGNNFCYLCSQQWIHGHICENQNNNQIQQQGQEFENLNYSMLFLNEFDEF